MFKCCVWRGRERQSQSLWTRYPSPCHPHVVTYDHVLLHVVQEHTGALDEALGQPRRPAAVHDVHRVVERQLRKVDDVNWRSWCRLAQERVEVHGRTDLGQVQVVRRVDREAHDDHLLHGRQLRDNVPELRQRVHAAALVEVPVCREHNFRGDLCEAVEYALGAKVRRAARPDRSEARGCEHRDDRFGDVGRVRDHTVACADAELCEPRRQLRHTRVQLSIRHHGLLVARLGPEHDRRVLVAEAQEVLCKVEAAAREERGARHLGDVVHDALVGR